MNHIDYLTTCSFQQIRINFETVFTLNDNSWHSPVNSQVSHQTIPISPLSISLCFPQFLCFVVDKHVSLFPEAKQVIWMISQGKALSLHLEHVDRVAKPRIKSRQKNMKNYTFWQFSDDKARSLVCDVNAYLYLRWQDIVEWRFGLSWRFGFCSRLTVMLNFNIKYNIL